MATTELTASDVANKVRPYIANKTIGDVTLSLDDERILLRNGYWRIPIRPSREPDPLFPYYEALADLEDELQENEGLKVSIASGNPLTD
jgi:hypothetical protein